MWWLKKAICCALRTPLSAPQLFTGDPRPLGQRRQLCPDYGGCNSIVDEGEGGEPAVGSRNDAFAPDNVGIVADPLRDQPGMLDKIGCRVDDPGDQDLVVGDFCTAQILPFMRVARIGSLERQSG